VVKPDFLVWTIMKRVILFSLLALACGPDAPATPQALAESPAPPVPHPADPAAAPDPTGFAPPVTLLDSRPTSRGCDPNYDPCVPADSDVDCPGGRGNGPSYASGPVRVIGTDVYGLDRDGDGTGCDR
jgi:hypothetical protein